VKSVTVREDLAEVWIGNDTGGTLTVEIVGVEKRNFSTGEHYWRTVTPGTYTIKAWGCGNPEPYVGTHSFWVGENWLRFICESQSAPQSREPPSQLQAAPE
jgi:hypothetical protein